MSGIYISNMKMPANCSDCPMCYDMMECVIGNPYISFYRKEMKEEPFDFCNERHPRCPLIPIPDHGDLIEADKVMVALSDMAKEYPKNPLDSIGGYMISKVRKAIEKLPIIIPADKEE